MQYIYKITYPNGKIYIGQDVMERFLTYFGSGDTDYIQKDFSLDQMKNFTIKKEMIWSGEGLSVQELTRKEHELIVSCGANNPETGYNLIPKFP